MRKIVRKIKYCLVLLVLTTSCIDDPTGLLEEEEGGSGGGVRALMFTPAFVHVDQATVRSVARQASKSSNYNAILSTIDLQSGRGYIFEGRTGTGIHPQAVSNIKAIKSAGLKPIVIVRNDWAARTGTGSIPSIGRKGSNSNFYTSDLLQQETVFISNLVDTLGASTSVMLGFEANAPQSVDFYLELIKNARQVAGLKGVIYVNFIGGARGVAESKRSEFAKFNAKFATSQNTLGFNLGEDVINTDGNMGINASNVKGVIDTLKSTGKPYFLWSDETRQSSVPPEYF